mmetsp:Transcript_1817/g.6654  ORF Transcript_1817/g.6654 Transcript_1817/m.6654 type:complete len:267 (+) Transcript_1817:1602-2402(+)
MAFQSGLPAVIVDRGSPHDRADASTCAGVAPPVMWMLVSSMTCIPAALACASSVCRCLSILRNHVYASSSCRRTTQWKRRMCGPCPAGHLCSMTERSAEENGVSPIPAPVRSAMSYSVMCWHGAACGPSTRMRTLPSGACVAPSASTPSSVRLSRSTCSPRSSGKSSKRSLRRRPVHEFGFPHLMCTVSSSAFGAEEMVKGCHSKEEMDGTLSLRYCPSLYFIVSRMPSAPTGFARPSSRTFGGSHFACTSRVGRMLTPRSERSTK